MLACARISMTRVQTTASIALVLLLTASLVSPSEGWRGGYLEDDPLRMDQFGGGGSLEDLWCFNSEALARAVFECPVPVVTGVGHETDVTLVDWVADLRAPTPSAATVAALPDGDQLARDLGEHWRRLVAAMRALLAGRAEVWSREREVLRRLAPSARLAAQRRRMFSARRALFRAGLHQAEIRRGQLARTVARLDSLSPLGVLARGYALVRKEPEGTLLRRAEEVAVGDRLEIRLGDGEISAVVEGED